jgi:two-component system phosphate regulon response regulator PhoB
MGSRASRERHRLALVAGASELVTMLGRRLPEIEVQGGLIGELERLARELRPQVIVAAGEPASATLDALLALRAAGTDARILFLTAPGAERERLAALEAGVDEALATPMTSSEIAGRVHLLARRARQARIDRLPIGEGLELDLARRQLLRNGRWVHLRPKEARLLELFARSPGRALNRDHILRRVWGPGYTGDRRTVDVHVRWLRSKIEAEPPAPRLLLTVRGVGYRLEMPGPLTER